MCVKVIIYSVCEKHVPNAVLFALAADFFLVPALLVLVHKKNTLK